MRVLPLVFLAALGGAECERTPSEDFASQRWIPGAAASAAVRPAADAVASTAPPATARCVQPLTARPPPAPQAGPAPGCPPDPEGPLPTLPTVRVTFPQSPAAVEAELVRSEHDTARGLMYRKRLAENSGMLFDLRVRDDHKFWMHNTCIPLDLLYIDEDGLVVGIVENAPTLDDGSRGVDCPSRFVLEVNAGWSRRHGVTPGQRMTVPPEARSL